MCALLGQREGDACRTLDDSVRQLNLPATFGVVHLEHESRFAWRMTDAGFDEKKVGTHLRDANADPVDEQCHLYMG